MDIMGTSASMLIVPQAVILNMVIAYIQILAGAIQVIIKILQIPSHFKTLNALDCYSEDVFIRIKQDGQVTHVMSACGILVVQMVIVICHGSAFVNQAGMERSATRQVT